MAPPPAKKRRFAAPAAAVSRRTTRSQKPRLNAELLAKVATYSSLGRDLLNLCVVVGPKDCALIRHAYLRNNLHYLEASLRKFCNDEEEDDWDYNSEVELCRGRYLAWMEVNTDWRRLVTTEQMDSLVTVFEEDKEGISVENINPLLPFNNPAVAIELGLMDPLKHLVEKMGIDINAYRWTTFIDTPGSTSRDHLLMICVDVGNFCAFKYLLGRETIDVWAQSQKDEGEEFTVFEQCFMYAHRTAFFREILRHPDCSLDAAFAGLIDDDMDPIHAHVAIRMIEMLCLEDDLEFHSSTLNDNFRLLLESGVDKDARDQFGRDAIQNTKYRLAEASAGSVLQKALKDALQILEEWMATK